MKEDERLSRMSEEQRIATMWRTEHDNDKCYAALKPIVTELNGLRAKPQESINYIGMRLTIMSMLTSVDRPWEAWALIKPDIELLESIGAQRGVQFLKLEHAATMTGTYLKMKDLVASQAKCSRPRNSNRCRDWRKSSNASSETAKHSLKTKTISPSTCRSTRF